MEAYGIKNTKEVIVLAFSMGKALKEARDNDGKIDYTDAMLIMGIIPAFGPAFSDIKMVASELKDLSVEESKEISLMVMAEFGDIVSEAKVISQVDLGLKAMIAMYEFVQSLRKEDEAPAA